ncbi:MAG TPA: DUF4168 domain-containing protein [Microcoleaceae cyanobacterium]|jgi:hypothetical protein
MINPSINSLRSRLSPTLSRVVMVGILSTAGLLAGLTPHVSFHGSSLLSETAAYAQQPPGDLGKYTKVARQIERQRMQYYAEAKQILNGNVPDNVCQQKNLPGGVREICDRFDRKVRDILAEHKMPVSEFNQLTKFCSAKPKPDGCP